MTRLDLPELADAFSRADGQRRSAAVVLPLRQDMREVASEFLSEGPPFDPEELGLGAHRVFLTDNEVVFVFESDQPRTGARARPG